MLNIVLSVCIPQKFLTFTLHIPLNMSKKSNIITIVLGLLIVTAIAGAYFLNQEDKEPTLLETKTMAIANYGTYQNPELAYIECQKILTSLSKTINTSNSVKSIKNK